MDQRKLANGLARFLVPNFFLPQEYHLTLTLREPVDFEADAGSW
jgi:hypothetical protein